MTGIFGDFLEGIFVLLLTGSAQRVAQPAHGFDVAPIARFFLVPSQQFVFSHREQLAVLRIIPNDQPGALGFTAEEAKEAWLCTCKQTGNPPFCDGSHNSLI